MELPAFKQLIWDFYKENGRSFAWRETEDPYEVFVSEIMLQQTQTSRVEVKYVQFLASLPTVESLAVASKVELLTLWQGLGYNRRALNMQRAAQVVVEKYGGIFPTDQTALDELPGIGPYTAGAIRTFAYNLPSTFIETNIRRVYLHHFFADKTDVLDKELLPIISATQDESQPRNWYYALMDYGVELGKTLPNPNRRSAHYAKQSAFAGSKRQLRGLIVRLLTGLPSVTILELAQRAETSPEQVEECVKELATEGFLHLEGDVAIIAG